MTPVHFSKDGSEPVRCIECLKPAAECEGGQGVLFTQLVKTEEETPARRPFLCIGCVAWLFMKMGMLGVVGVDREQALDVFNERTGRKKPKPKRGGS